MAEAGRLARMVKLARAQRTRAGEVVMLLYRALLHLYPASFRAEYGEEMAAVFRRRLRDANNGSPGVAIGIGVPGETLSERLAVHGDILGQDLRYTVRTLNRSPGSPPPR